MNLNWAIEKEHAEEPKLLDTDYREIVWFDILDFLKHPQRPWTLDPRNLKSVQEIKVKKAKKHFESGGWMDPTDIQGIRRDGRILAEGRHRLVAALQLGETYAPFSVPKEIIDDLKSTIVTR